MRYGEVLSVTKAGIRIPARTLVPIGISHGSRCWGIWTGRQRKGVGPEKPQQIPHLVISPVHPDLWTSVFQLEIALEEKIGSLASATRLLAQDHVNILLAEQAPSGYDQATLSLLCEFTEVTKFCQEILRGLPDLNLNGVDVSKFVTAKEDHRHEFAFKQIGIAMLLRQVRLFALLRKQEHQWFVDSQGPTRRPPADPLEQPFFPSRLVETGPQPWYLRNDDLVAVAVALEAMAHQKNPPGPREPWHGLLSDDMASAFSSDVEDALRGLKESRHTKAFMPDPPYTEEANEVRRISAYSLPDKPRLRDEVPGRLDHVIWLLRRFWRRSWARPLHFQNLLRLAYQRVWSASSAIEFEFDESRDMLVPSTGSMTDVVGRHGGRQVELPNAALGVVHRGERFLRIRFVKEDGNSGQMAAANVKYGFIATGSGTSNEHPGVSMSMGLLAELGKAIAGAGLSIVQVSNSSESTQPTEERGTLRFTVKDPETRWPIKNLELARRVEESINSGLKAFTKSPPVKMISQGSHVSVEIVGTTRVFVSMPQEAAHRRQVVAIATRAAGACGCELDFADENNPGNITSDVVERVRRSSAVLQFIILRETERQVLLGGRSPKPDFQWLWYEAGLAKMAGKPLIRFMDRSIPEELRPAARPKADVENITHYFDSQVLYGDALFTDLVRVMSHAIGQARES